MNSISLEQLREWEKAASEEVQRLREQQNDIEGQLRKAERQLDLLRQMLSLQGATQAMEGPPTGFSGASPKPTSQAVREAVKRIIEEAGQPLHISDIHKEFLRRGLPVPGGGTPFNILVHIVKNREFVRVKRGTYALNTGDFVAAEPEDTQPKKTRRRRKKRKHHRGVRAA